MTVSLSIPAHAVQADLPGGPAFQACPCADTATALFDRLRTRFPAITVQRFMNGTAVEIAMPWPAPIDPASG